MSKETRRLARLFQATRVSENVLEITLDINSVSQDSYFQDETSRSLTASRNQWQRRLVFSSQPMQAVLRFPGRDLSSVATTAAESEPSVPGEPRGGPEVAQLIRNAQHRDIAAFEQLMAMHKSKILSYARAFVSDAEQAHDVAQDAMLRIYRSLGSFRHQSSLQTWMFRIIRNIVLDYAKSRRSKERKREQPLDKTPESDMGEPASDSPEAQLLAHERKSQLWLALAEVPETYRSVLVLCDLQGMSYEEVAAIVSTPVGTVKSRLNRGREALRLTLLAQGHYGDDVPAPQSEHPRAEGKKP